MKYFKWEIENKKFSVSNIVRKCKIILHLVILLGDRAGNCLEYFFLLFLVTDELRSLQGGKV